MLYDNYLQYKRTFYQLSLTSDRASERCHQEKRKTINGEDILFAMSTLGFDSYVEPLKLYLQKYREVGYWYTINQSENIASTLVQSEFLLVVGVPNH